MGWSSICAAGRRSDLASALIGAGFRLETIMPTQQLEDAFLDLLEVGADGPSGLVQGRIGGTV